MRDGPRQSGAAPELDRSSSAICQRVSECTQLDSGYDGRRLGGRLRTEGGWRNENGKREYEESHGLSCEKKTTRE
jgi:hypothetical protein